MSASPAGAFSGYNINVFCQANNLRMPIATISKVVNYCFDEWRLCKSLQEFITDRVGPCVSAASFKVYPSLLLYAI